MLPQRDPVNYLPRLTSGASFICEPDGAIKMLQLINAQRLVHADIRLGRRSAFRRAVGRFSALWILPAWRWLGRRRCCNGRSCRRSRWVTRHLEPCLYLKPFDHGRIGSILFFDFLQKLRLVVRPGPVERSLLLHKLYSAPDHSTDGAEIAALRPHLLAHAVGGLLVSVLAAFDGLDDDVHAALSAKPR